MEFQVNHLHLYTKEIVINHYPVQWITYYDSLHNSAMCVIKKEKHTSIVANSLLKRIISQFKANTGSQLPVHAAAISIDGYGYMFMAGGRAGKSTTYFNLLLADKSNLAINDDIIFLQTEEENVYVSGPPTLIHLRENSLQYVGIDISSILCQLPIGGEGEYCIDAKKYLGNENANACKIKCIFFTTVGFEKTSIYPLKDKVTYVKRVLRAFTAHRRPAVVSQDFVDLFTYFMKLPFYTIELSGNPNEFLKVFQNFIEMKNDEN